MIKIYNYYDFLFCKLGIAEQDGSICGVFFYKDKRINLQDYIQKDTPLLKKASEQIDDYFNGKRKIFDIPVVLNGTEFQVKIWKALQKIPYGETRSYKEIAAMIGNPKASRAVGMANNRNPISIIVPCHRVIGHDGKLTGYAGGLELKQKLILLEQN
jgi:methylated-DNA-[protein]-cysteine S-methyltransferase